MKTKKAGPGRPRTRSEDIVVFNAQLTSRARNRLKALAQVEDDYAYKILESAFWSMWESLPPRRREAAEKIAKALESIRETSRAQSPGKNG
ncbi:MAG: hypothetical protein AAF481_02430 [Acidobacteriota bacterium]